MQNYVNLKIESNDTEIEETVTSLASSCYKILFKKPITIQICKIHGGYYLARVLEYSWWEGIGSTPEEAKDSLITQIFGSWSLAKIPDEKLAEGAKEEKRIALQYIE